MLHATPNAAAVWTSPAPVLICSERHRISGGCQDHVSIAPGCRRNTSHRIFESMHAAYWPTGRRSKSPPSRCLRDNGYKASFGHRRSSWDVPAMRRRVMESSPLGGPAKLCQARLLGVLACRDPIKVAPRDVPASGGAGKEGELPRAGATVPRPAAARLRAEPRDRLDRPARLRERTAPPQEERTRARTVLRLGRLLGPPLRRANQARRRLLRVQAAPGRVQPNRSPGRLAHHHSPHTRELRLPVRANISLRVNRCPSMSAR